MKRIILLIIVYAIVIIFCVFIPSVHMDAFMGIKPDYIGDMVSGHIFARWTLAALAPVFVSGFLFETNKRIKPFIVIRLRSSKTYIKRMFMYSYLCAVIWSLMIIPVQYVIDSNSIIGFAALFTASQILNVSFEGVIYFAADERTHSLIIFPLMYIITFYVCDRNPIFSKYSIASIEMIYRSKVWFEYGLSIQAAVFVLLTSSVMLLIFLREVIRWKALLWKKQEKS